MKLPSLGYEPSELPRELKRHYISATETELRAMLGAIGKIEFSDLYSHVPESVRMQSELAIPRELGYEDLQQCLFEISRRNRRAVSFLGDGLPQFRVQSIVPHVLGLRRLTTAYTPYQPERSQGTLATHWIYQSALAAISGFEAVNASFYDRSTALFEAMKCAQRLVRDSDTVIVAGSLYPGDIEVLHTHASGTDLRIEVIGVDANTGRIDVNAVRNAAAAIGDRLAAIVFPQTNCLGNLEDVDALADLARERKVRSIAVVDPILLGKGSLKPPREFGAGGTDMFVAEGQHLAIGPNFGGPGLGIFGIRFNDACRNDIRQTAGRFVGKGKDANGRDAYSIVLSTREQHIRREKATSNICSNQAYVATVAGAALLERGAEGVAEAGKIARANAQAMAERLTRYAGVKLAFPKTPFFNEITLALPRATSELIEAGVKLGVHVGVDVGARLAARAGNFLLVSFSDIHAADDLDRLEEVFAKAYGAAAGAGDKGAEIPASQIRKSELPLPQIPVAQLKRHYEMLGEQNVSPDENIYALGSCTMKYNPYINDWAAALAGFSESHPEAPEADVQGSLQIIFETQELFKSITGLHAVTTQPVAGAQGELVGLKLFQAYHRERGEAATRDVILIPRTAHGTNPATATMAGFVTKEGEGGPGGVVLIESNTAGEMDMDHVRKLVEQYGRRIAGVMVTNPNTSGILETRFREMADLIHGVGGLVYMDGANMNAIAGWLDLGKLGVDAVHNNTHKTWTIPHGGGGPGDAFVAVSEKLVDFLPGIQVVKEGDRYKKVRPRKSIGSFHRHFGNFAHKVRCYTYVRALGREGVVRMAAVAVLSANYLYQALKKTYPTLPAGAEASPRMHEFILTLEKELFAKAEAVGLKKSDVIPRVGKLFLDFGLHAPTVAFPEVFGLMIEPTESYTKAELDRFVEVVRAIHQLVAEHPEVLLTTPHFTPIDKVDEVGANKDLMVSEVLTGLPKVLPNRIASRELDRTPVREIARKIVEASAARRGNA